MGDVALLSPPTLRPLSLQLTNASHQRVMVSDPRLVIRLVAGFEHVYLGERASKQTVRLLALVVAGVNAQRRILLGIEDAQVVADAGGGGHLASSFGTHTSGTPCSTS